MPLANGFALPTPPDECLRAGGGAWSSSSSLLLLLKSRSTAELANTGDAERPTDAPAAVLAAGRLNADVPTRERGSMLGATLPRGWLRPVLVACRRDASPRWEGVANVRRTGPGSKSSLSPTVSASLSSEKSAKTPRAAAIATFVP